MDATVDIMGSEVPADNASASTGSSLSQRKKKAPVKRVQLDLPARSMERLNDLKDMTEAASYAEVIRNALRLYEDMAQKAASGREFLIRDTSGNIAPYEAFLSA